MEWLHGGAFGYGSGNRAVTDGANLSGRGNIVVVSVNHSLNIFGFLHLAAPPEHIRAMPGCSTSSPHWAGCMTISRRYRGVRWRSRKLTIFGESGGGGKVCVLLAMPAARGLFHRAIIQSGAAIRVSTRERANAFAEAVLKELGVGRNECELLQAFSAERLLPAIAPVARAVGRCRWPLLDRYDFGPVVDGSDLPQHPAEPAAPALSDDIPLMIGGTREESAFFLADDDAVWKGTLAEQELRQRVAALAGGQTDALLAAYSAAMPLASPADRLIAALTGSNFWVRTVLLAERYATRRPRPGLHVLARLAEHGPWGAGESAPRNGSTLCLR